MADDMETERPTPYTVSDPITDEAAILSDINMRLDRIEKTMEAQTQGINTIGDMMNHVATLFDDLAGKVKQGGIGALLGGIMGGKNGS